MTPVVIRRDHNQTQALQRARNAKLQAYYDAFGEAERADAERPAPVIEPYQSPAGAPASPGAPAREPIGDPDDEPTPVDPLPPVTPEPQPAAAVSPPSVAPKPVAAVPNNAAQSQLRPGYQPSRNHRR